MDNIPEDPDNIIDLDKIRKDKEKELDRKIIDKLVKEADECDW